MNVVCVIVTYNPDSDFPLRLKNIQKEFNQIIIVDNNSDSKLEITDSNTITIYNSSNLGIATALNQGIAEAAASGADYICFFDQDSTISGGFVEMLLRGFEAGKNVGVVAANYVNPISKRPGYPVSLQGKKDESYSPISHAITSGSMIKTSILPVCGSMRDDYFIDYVDVEFCERVRASGYAILCTNKILMTHPIGEATNHTFLSHKLTASNHSPLRRYYMARNCIVSSLENFKQNPKFSKISIQRLIKIVIVTLLFETNKMSKSRAIFLGIIDGYFYRMGKTERNL